MEALSDTNPIKAHLNAIIESFSLLLIIDDLRKHKVQKINLKKHALFRSSIIHICASWETFLEHAMLNSLLFIEKNATTSKQIPINVLLEVSNRLKNKKDARLIWNISDNGWKNELKINFELLKEGFNTPRPEKVDDFVLKSIGLKNLSHHWSWKRQSYMNSINKLNDFMDLRGKITHRIVSDKKVHEHIMADYLNFIYRISVISANVIRNHVHSLTQKYPWEVNTYRKLL